MSKKALVIFADGFEEIEAVAPVDILRRAGVEVTVAGLASLEQTSARGVRVICDSLLEDTIVRAGEFDALVLPGGGRGAENLADSAVVRELVLRMHGEGKIIAAICAAPAVVLVRTGILSGKKATCYPGMQVHFGADTLYLDEQVVEDGNIITGRGAGAAAVFSLAIVGRLCGTGTRDRIAHAMM